ncbi:MAG: hypothetical protein JWQ38_519 [Flavipsychrobacter sp.]|nr:hypothetical protein [Flavipsychrobacter sp.]
MKKSHQFLIVCMALIVAIGCRSVSKYTIDSNPVTKTDSGLLGIWKAMEDTSVADFILVQSPYDVHHPIIGWDSVNKRPAIIGEGNIADKRLAATLDVERTKRERHEEIMKEQGLYYYITYFNHHGINPLYQQWTAFPSVVGNSKFLNVYYQDEHILGGHFFVRLIHINKSYDSITTAIIADTTLDMLNNAKELRNRVTKNIKSPSFYSDTLHFYKANGYHLTLKGAVLKAN